MTLERVLGWLRRLACDRADQVVEAPGGVGLLSTRFPSAHDHNQLLLWREATAEQVVAAADEVLGGAGLVHRRVHVQSESLALTLEAGLRGAGYATEREVLMSCRAAALPAGDGSVEVLTLDERVAAAVMAWAGEQPTWPAEVTGQLGGRIETVPAAVDATFLAVRGAAGVLARADLFVRDGLAQIEEVLTDPAARNRGLASALVREGVRRAAAAGADTVFLVADADDWPAGLYRRLGFTELGRTSSFAR